MTRATLTNAVRIIFLGGVMLSGGCQVLGLGGKPNNIVTATPFIYQGNGGQPLNLSSATVTPPPAATKSALDYLHPYNETADAQVDIAAALSLAQTDHKDVLLDFGGNWCPDCIVLAKYYETEPLQTYVQTNYHIVSIDIGTFNKNQAIANRYGNPIQNGVPAVVILNPSGAIVGSTGNGALESARSMTLDQVMAVLKQWPAHN